MCDTIKLLGRLVKVILLQVILVAILARLSPSRGVFVPPSHNQSTVTGTMPVSPLCSSDAEDALITRPEHDVNQNGISEP